MADQNNGPDNSDANQTSDDQSGAPDNEGEQSATHDVQIPDGFELIKTEDKNNLVSQRDKNFNDSKDIEEEVQDLKETISRDKFIKSFLRENSDDYPDVLEEDLESATSEDEVEALAKERQALYEKVEQRALDKLKNVPAPPPMSEDDRQRKSEDLLKRAQKGEDVFDEWLEFSVL